MPSRSDDANDDFRIILGGILSKSDPLENCLSDVCLRVHLVDEVTDEAQMRLFLASSSFTSPAQKVTTVRPC
jgi:hypothetical protein